MTRRGRITYSAAEMQWLSDNRSMVISDYHRAFCAAFDRADVALAHLQGLRKRLGWKVGRAPGRFAGRRRLFSPEEVKWLRDNCTLPPAEYLVGFRAAFSRDDVTVGQLKTLRKSSGWKTGRTGHFAKGVAPWSKGKKLPFNAGSARTQFKKGQLPGNTKFDGHERADPKTGFILVRVSERNPWTGAATRYRPKQHVLWGERHGPIPKGMALKCKGDPTNADPSNWEMVPRSMLPRLNNRWGRNYDDAPAELKPTIMAVAKLENGVSERRKQLIKSHRPEGHNQEQ